MKRLITVRHGKSSWEEDLPDNERPLKKRAFKDADLVINALKAYDLGTPVAWSSYAVRALTTAKIFKERLGIKDANFEVRKDLYTFDGRELLEIVSTCEDSVETLMLFGHNPAMTNLVNNLGDQRFTNVPTTGLTLIEFETDSWKDLKNGKTILYLFPKNLR